MQQPDIEQNRNAGKYTAREQLRRILWMGGLILFRMSPRPLFGFRRWWLRLFGARIGREVHIYPSAHVYFPWNLEIGDWSSIGEWALIYNLGPVTIGERATISQRVHLCAGTHDYRDPAMPLLKLPISIGDSAWICADAFIGPGTKVGTGAVVGACSVVVKDVTPWMVVAGNPACEIKARVMNREGLQNP